MSFACRGTCGGKGRGASDLPEALKEAPDADKEASGSCSVSVSALVSCVPKLRSLLVESMVTALRSDISSRKY